MFVPGGTIGHRGPGVPVQNASARSVLPIGNSSSLLRRVGANGRYRMHGGLPPGLPESSRNAFKDGHYVP